MSKNKKEIDLTIESPFKSKNLENTRPKHKTQQKLTKMQNYDLKTVPKHSDTILSKIEENKEKVSKQSENKTSESLDPDLKKLNTPMVNQAWKVKAIIDNRNFLIPVS